MCVSVISGLTIFYWIANCCCVLTWGSMVFVVVVVVGSPKFPKVLCLGSVLMSFSLPTLVCLLVFPLFKSPLLHSASHADKTSRM